MQATIDNTPPEIQEVLLGMVGNTLTVDARDESSMWVGVALFNSTGKVRSWLTPAPTQTPCLARLAINPESGQGKRHKFLLQVYDYAYNVTTHELKADLGQVPALPPITPTTACTTATGPALT